MGLRKARNELGRMKPKTTKELNAAGLKVPEPVNDRYTTAVNYREYDLVKK